MAQKKLFTFVLDYRGGIYISQVVAADPVEALGVWCDTLNLDDIWGLTNRSRAVLREGIFEHQIVPVDTVRNVWCVSGGVRGALAIVNIIHTNNGRLRRGRPSKQ